MTEWEVFLLITVLVGFLTAVVTPLIKLNNTITELTTTTKNLTKSLDEYKVSNAEAHRRIWEELESHDHVINTHETRLMIIESKGGRNEDFNRNNR